MRKARSPACNNDTRPSRKRNARGGRRAAPPATKEHGESRRRNAVGEDGGQPRLVRRHPPERERRRVHHLRAEYANLGAGRRHRAVCSEHRVKTTEKKTVNTAEYGQLNTCPLGRWLGYMNTYSASTVHTPPAPRRERAPPPPSTPRAANMNKNKNKNKNKNTNTNTNNNNNNNIIIISTPRAEAAWTGLIIIIIITTTTHLGRRQLGRVHLLTPPALSPHSPHTLGGGVHASRRHRRRDALHGAVLREKLEGRLWADAGDVAGVVATAEDAKVDEAAHRHVELLEQRRERHLADRPLDARAGLRAEARRWRRTASVPACSAA